MRRFLFSLLAVALADCNSKPNEIKLEKLDKDTTLVLSSNASHPTTLLLTLKGFANDSFSVQDFIKLPGGKIDSSFKLDCYTKDYYLHYQSYKATKGRLSVIYRIE